MSRNTRKKNGKERRIITRVEWPLYDELVERAEKQQRSVSQFVRLILWEYVGKVAR